MRPSRSSDPARHSRIKREKFGGLCLRPEKAVVNQRSHERVSLKIPARLRMLGKESQGFTYDLSSTGLRLIY